MGINVAENGMPGQIILTMYIHVSLMPFGLFSFLTKDFFGKDNMHNFASG